MVDKIVVDISGSEKDHIDNSDHYDCEMNCGDERDFRDASNA